MKGDYVIINLKNMDFMKTDGGQILYYQTEEGAREVCGMYELQDVWVMKLVYNHIEPNYSPDSMEDFKR